MSFTDSCPYPFPRDRRGSFVFWMELMKEVKVREFMFLQLKSRLVIPVFVSVGWISLCCGQTTSPAPTSKVAPGSPASEQQPTQQLPGTIKGIVVDPSGAVVASARVQLTGENKASQREARSGSDGQFSFASIPPGAFQLTITATGFAPQTFSGTLQPGEIQTVGLIALNMAEASTEVYVGLTQVEVAEEQIKIEEKQRVLGIVPNFYVTYIPDAVPLTAREKFKLAWRTVIDPFTVVVVSGAAGVEQAQNHFAGYGQGAQGYAKRFGAGYGDTIVGTFIGGAILPSVLKQDPRYFYKGTGSKAFRFGYAIANAFICKGDNRRWQPNYSNILGSLAAGGISNLYYPRQDRDGAGLTVENAAIGIGATAIGNVFQEFVARRLTRKVPNQSSAKSGNLAN